MIVDIKVAKKWNSIPKDIQFKILDNVFCSKCHVTTIVDYTMKNDKLGILIEGKCIKCGKEVVRLVEDI